MNRIIHVAVSWYKTEFNLCICVLCVAINIDYELSDALDNMWLIIVMI